MPLERRSGDLTLNPGELFVGAAPQRARTLLGSCVAITLWHPQLRVGAMSHCLLPERPQPGDGRLDGRYVDEALEWMAQQLARRGAPLQRCEAKLFGGGNMFGEQRVAGPEVGLRNGQAARRLLAERGLVPVAEHLFGAGHRQLLFDLSTGIVWCQLKRAAPESR
jgi:chemotaxis protein CheD